MYPYSIWYSSTVAVVAVWVGWEEVGKLLRRQSKRSSLLYYGSRLNRARGTDRIDIFFNAQLDHSKRNEIGHLDALWLELDHSSQSLQVCR